MKTITASVCDCCGFHQEELLLVFSPSAQPPLISPLSPEAPRKDQLGSER